jgi:hypothetical protein
MKLKEAAVLKRQEIEEKNRQNDEDDRLRQIQERRTELAWAFSRYLFLTLPKEIAAEGTEVIVPANAHQPEFTVTLKPHPDPGRIYVDGEVFGFERSRHSGYESKHFFIARPCPECGTAEAIRYDLNYGNTLDSIASVLDGTAQGESNCSICATKRYEAEEAGRNLKPKPQPTCTTRERQLLDELYAAIRDQNFGEAE